MTLAVGARTHAKNPSPSARRERDDARGPPRKVPMLQSSEYNYNGKSTPTPETTYNPNPVKTTSVPVEQATIGRSLVIKGEVSGAESLYIDGRIEGKISVPDNRVTIGRNGSVQANISAKEVVVMGKVNGNIECSDRVDIRSEGSVTGDVSTMRIIVEEGAILKGGIEVRSGEQKHKNNLAKATEMPKAMAATASA